MDKRFTPPPLSTSAEVNNIHTNNVFINIWWPPPPLPLATFINTNNIF